VLTPPHRARSTVRPADRTTHGRFLAGATAVALLAVASFAAPADAQAAPREFVTPFTAVWFGAGTVLVDVSRLNPHFERTDLPELQRPGFFTISNDGFSVGGGAYGPVLPRLLLGAEAHWGDIGEESSPSGKTNHLRTRFAMVTVGFAALTGWRYTLHPFLGIGTGSVRLTLQDRAGGSGVSGTQNPTFDDVVMSPGAESTLKGSYVIVQPGVGFDYLVLRGSGDRVGLVLGLRVSTAVSPNRTTWRHEGREAFGGPDVGPVGGMFRLVAGVGGFRIGQ